MILTFPTSMGFISRIFLAFLVEARAALLAIEFPNQDASGMISTVNSTATPTWYNDLVVIPKHLERIESVDVAIRHSVSQERTHTIRTSSRRSGIEFWSVRPNSTEYEHLNAVLSIDDVAICGNLEIAEAQDLSTHASNFSVRASENHDLRAGPSSPSVSSVKLQKPAPWNLAVMSWAPTVKYIWDLKGYAYLWNQPRQAFVYVIDNGLDSASSRDFFSPHRGVAWYFPPWALHSRTDESEGWHGSCVSSLAAGLLNGVAKESKIMMFKSSQRLRDVYWAFSSVRDTFISSGNAKNSSVIIFTASAPNSSESLPYWTRVKEIMQELFDADAVIVVPAGNYAQKKGRSRQVDTIPARWSSPTFPLIVVGAVDDLRFPAPFSQGPQNITVFAPGVNVGCAHNAKVSGTSYAAALVSGLLAYYLSFENPPFLVGGGQTAQHARSYLKQPQSSWARSYDGTNVIWNGQDGSTRPSPVDDSVAYASNANYKKTKACSVTVKSRDS